VKCKKCDKKMKYENTTGRGFDIGLCEACEYKMPLSSDAVLDTVTNLTDENIQELREIILDHNSSKAYQNTKIKDWFVRSFS